MTPMRFALLFIFTLCVAGCGEWGEIPPDPMRFFHPDGRVKIAKQVVGISNPPEMAGWGYDFFAWQISGKEEDISSQVSVNRITQYYVWSRASTIERCRIGIEACKNFFNDNGKNDYAKIAPLVDTILKADDTLVCFETYSRNSVDEKLVFSMWLCSPKQKLIMYVGLKE